MKVPALVKAVGGLSTERGWRAAGRREAKLREGKRSQHGKKKGFKGRGFYAFLCDPSRPQGWRRVTTSRGGRPDDYYGGQRGANRQ